MSVHRVLILLPLCYFSALAAGLGVIVIKTNLFSKTGGAQRGQRVSDIDNEQR